jgi:hypothetical protein
VLIPNWWKGPAVKKTAGPFLCPENPLPHLLTGKELPVKFDRSFLFPDGPVIRRRRRREGGEKIKGESIWQ